MAYRELFMDKVKTGYSLKEAALSFIRDDCTDLRYNSDKVNEREKGKEFFTGKSIKSNQIPYNMQMDIDRLCFEKALERFLDSGRKEDAFDVYYSYLEMFIGDYKDTRRMIELLSEYEANGSGLLIKHRDHYSHSVYVFSLGLAIYHTNSIFRETYKKYYEFEDEQKAAHHFLEFWGMTSLFHDIGYPFELPFEQAASYFEVEGDKRKDRPYLAYEGLSSFVKLDEKMVEKLKNLFTDGEISDFETTEKLFAYVLEKKLGKVYSFTKEGMADILTNKPTNPNKFNHFMDHAYFSSTMLFRRLFCELDNDLKLKSEHLDALSAILLHNSLYKFSVAFYKDEEKNIPLKAELHPLAFLLMLCDELQAWDRTAYGRNSKKELHPMGCETDFSNNEIKICYLFDEKETLKIKAYENEYEKWMNRKPENVEEIEAWKKEKPSLKAYSGMHEKNEKGISAFQEDIERIVDLKALLDGEDVKKIRISVDKKTAPKKFGKNVSFLSESNFIHLYNFAVVLNGRWGNKDWKKAKEEGTVEKFISDKKNLETFENAFRELSLEYKLSNINQAKAFAKYMAHIDSFYTDRPVDFEQVEAFTEEELLKIGILEHKRWLTEHYEMGWSYGEPAKEERDYLRLHKDMIPNFGGGEVTDAEAEANYKRLDKEEQDKDTEPMECMLAMLKMYDGLRIYRLR